MTLWKHTVGAMLASVIFVGAAMAADPAGTVAEGKPEGANAENPKAKKPGKNKGKKGKPAEGEKKKNPGQIFDRFDQDGDGKIVLADVPEKVREKLAKRDKNNDGVISKDEVPGAEGDAPAKKDEPVKKNDVAKGDAQAEAMFTKMDANGDGKLEGDEIPERMKKNLDKVDANKDGVVDKNEMMAAAEKMRAAAGGALLQRFKEMDSDGDGKVALKEMPERIRMFASRADADKDGILTLDELKKGMPMGAAGGGAAGMNPDRLFGRIDTNGDGAITADEMPKAKGLPVASFDSDKDGAVSKKELADGLAKMPAPANGKGPGGKKVAPGGKRPVQIFNDQDIDADGRVTKEEAKSPLSDNFDKWDVNKDGQLDLQEAQNGIKASEPTPEAPKDKAPAKA